MITAAIDQLVVLPSFAYLASWLVGAAASLLGGAMTGYIIGARDLGAELATQMGGLFGALSGLPGTAIALTLWATLI